MSKPPRIRVCIEFSFKISKIIRIPSRWITWILLVICFVLAHGLGHLPVHWAA
jgi:hypothetical protein